MVRIGAQSWTRIYSYRKLGSGCNACRLGFITSTWLDSPYGADKQRFKSDPEILNKEEEEGKNRYPEPGARKGVGGQMTCDRERDMKKVAIAPLTQIKNI